MHRTECHVLHERTSERHCNDGQLPLRSKRQVKGHVTGLMVDSEQTDLDGNVENCSGEERRSSERHADHHPTQRPTRHTDTQHFTTSHHHPTQRSTTHTDTQH